MTQQSSPTHMYVPAETSGSSSPTSSANKLFQMINLEELVLNVSHLSMVHPPPQKKATPYVSKNVKTSGKSSEPIILSKDKNVIEEESRSKGSELRNPSMHVDDTENPTEVERSAIDKELRKFVASVLKEVNSDVFPNVQTSLAKEPSYDNEFSEKAEESVPEHAARERISKNKVDFVTNVEGLSSDEEPLTNIVPPSTTKRLQRPKGNIVAFEDSPSMEEKRKASGLKERGKLSLLVNPSLNVEKDVRDITPIKRSANKKPRDTMPKAPLDNASLHYVKNAERWNLVKEFVVSITDGCDDTKSADYGKVKLEVTDDQVSKEITAKQVRHWPNKGKLPSGIHVPDIVMTSSQAPGPATSKKSVIAQLKETCKELEGSIISNTITKIKLETLMKAMMEEEKKEVVRGGDGNE
ncbi:uncharacterized protein LOC127102390 [Lathyrus oleraceus]|uniref:uncharacterized protein LOC127102390 n=1 Tax=Pisum sativum TaxID=3888 RepID=UPI0021D3C569|nr:uncharacterized protein LOC127102390 [Pisum sativum]